jgi:hypothetical protein
VSHKVEQALRHLLLDDEVSFLDDDLLADVIQGHEDGGHPQHPLLHLAVENGKALRLALLFEQRAVGDIARLQSNVERAVELVQAAIHQLQLVFAAGQHDGTPGCGQIAYKCQENGERGRVLKKFFQSKHNSARILHWQRVYRDDRGGQFFARPRCKRASEGAAPPARIRSKTGIFRRFSEAKSHDTGGFGSEKFSTDIDSKRVKNNLQGFKGNLCPLAIGGVGYLAQGYKPGGLLTEQTGHMPDGERWSVDGLGLLPSPVLMVRLCGSGGKFSANFLNRVREF